MTSKDIAALDFHVNFTVRHSTSYASLVRLIASASDGKLRVDSLHVLLENERTSEHYVCMGHASALLTRIAADRGVGLEMRDGALVMVKDDVLPSFDVQLFTATESKAAISFHQISRSTGERVRHQKVLESSVERFSDGPAVPVEKNEIVKGYEYTKGQYVIIEPSELENLKVPSKHTIDVSQFVEINELLPEYIEKPYFVVPEKDSVEAFTVMLALSRVRSDPKLSLVFCCAAVRYRINRVEWKLSPRGYGR